MLLFLFYCLFIEIIFTEIPVAKSIRDSEISSIDEDDRTIRNYEDEAIRKGYDIDIQSPHFDEESVITGGMPTIIPDENTSYNLREINADKKRSVRFSGRVDEKEFNKNDPLIPSSEDYNGSEVDGKRTDEELMEEVDVKENKSDDRELNVINDTNDEKESHGETSTNPSSSLRVDGLICNKLFERLQWKQPNTVSKNIEPHPLNARESFVELAKVLNQDKDYLSPKEVKRIKLASQGIGHWLTDLITFSELFDVTSCILENTKRTIPMSLVKFGLYDIINLPHIQFLMFSKNTMIYPNLRNQKLIMHYLSGQQDGTPVFYPTLLSSAIESNSLTTVRAIVKIYTQYPQLLFQELSRFNIFPINSMSHSIKKYLKIMKIIDTNKSKEQSTVQMTPQQRMTLKNLEESNEKYLMPVNMLVKIGELKILGVEIKL